MANLDKRQRATTPPSEAPKPGRADPQPHAPPPPRWPRNPHERCTQAPPDPRPRPRWIRNPDERHTQPRWVRNRTHRGGFGGLGPPELRRATRSALSADTGRPSLVEPRTDVGRGRGVQQHRLAELCENSVFKVPVRPAVCVRSARGCVRTPTAGPGGCPSATHRAGSRRAKGRPFYLVPVANRPECVTRVRVA
jgi:hypothetical protein